MPRALSTWKYRASGGGGLATNLLGEAFRQLQAQGISLAEVHVPEENSAAQAIFAIWASTSRCLDALLQALMKHRHMVGYVLLTLWIVLAE